MSLKKPLVMGSNGIPQQLQAGDQIIVDQSVTDVVSMTNAEASAAIVIGAPVYVFGAGTVKRAQANALSTADVLGLGYDVSITAAAAGKIATDGTLTASTGQWDAVTGQTGGLTAGARYFVDPANPGKLTATAPTTIGQVVCYVGKALNTTDMEITISDPILLQGAGMTARKPLVMVDGVVQQLQPTDSLDVEAAKGGIIPATARPTVRYGSHGTAATSTGTMPVNRLYMTPVVVPAITATRISIRVTTGVAATAVRMGIYNSLPDGSPGTLLLDCGTIATTSIADAPITINLTLAAGTYWLAAVFNGEPTVTCSNGNSGGLGRLSSNANYANILGYYRTYSYGALPSDETGQTYTNIVTGGQCPLLLIG